MTSGIRRTDIVAEEIAQEYDPDNGINVRRLAQRYDCSHNTIKQRLKKVDIEIESNPGQRREGYINIPFQKFNSKKEKANYICTVLKDPFTDFLIDIMRQMDKGGYAHNKYRSD